MLLQIVILALLVAIIKGGKLRRLADISLRVGWLVPLAIAIQVLIYIFAVKEIAVNISWLTSLMHNLSYLLLLFFVCMNFRIPGMRILGLGIALNAVVIVANNGLMPVDSTYLPAEKIQDLFTIRDGIHSLLTDNTRLSFLADRLFLSIPLIGRELFSFGDVLIDIGAFVLIYVAMTKQGSFPTKFLGHLR